MKQILLPVISFFFLNSLCAQNDSAKVFFEKGMVEQNAKHYLVATKHFDKAIELYPKYAAAYLQNGYANLLMRKTDAAKANFLKLYDIDPLNKEAIKELMELYFNYNQFQKAIEFAGKCNGCPNSERIIAMSSYKTENYPVAVKGLLNIVAANPKDAEAIYTLGRSYLEMELYTKAIPNYVKAIELDGTKSAWMHELGLIYYNLNDFKNAKVFLVKAAESGYPVSNDFNENLGYAYIYSGEFDKGVKILLDILEKKPGNKDILRDIAEAYYNQKLYDKSLEFCQKLIDLDSKDAKALYQAGLCFQKKGQKDRGQAMCDTAIKMDPSLGSLRSKKDSPVGL